MSTSDIAKILEAIGDLKTDIEVIKTNASANDDHGKRINRLEIACACLVVAFLASGISAAGIPLLPG
jgi:hypothetical protein